VRGRVMRIWSDSWASARRRRSCRVAVSAGGTDAPLETRISNIFYNFELIFTRKEQGTKRRVKTAYSVILPVYFEKSFHKVSSYLMFLSLAIITKFINLKINTPP
jgi:hypothetical protein